MKGNYPSLCFSLSSNGKVLFSHQTSTYKERRSIALLMSSIFSHICFLPLLFFNEIYLFGIMYWHYKWNYLTNTFNTAADFIFWMLLIDGGTIIPEKVAPLVVGYLVWAYANYFIYDANYFIIDSSQTGVLEQVYLSPTPFYFKLISRFFAGMIFCSVELLLVLSTLLIWWPLHIPLSIGALSTFLVTLIGIVGFALMLAGMGLVFKKSGPFAYLINNILLFLNGSILPLERMPQWLQVASKTLPTTQGIHVLRNLMFNHHTFVSALQDGSFLLLCTNSLFYLALGCMIFKQCEKQAQYEGSLGHY